MGMLTALYASVSRCETALATSHACTTLPKRSTLTLRVFRRTMEVKRRDATLVASGVAVGLAAGLGVALLGKKLVRDLFKELWVLFSVVLLCRAGALVASRQRCCLARVSSLSSASSSAQVVLDATKQFQYPRDVRPDAEPGKPAPAPHEEVPGSCCRCRYCCVLPYQRVALGLAAVRRRL